MQSYGFTLLGLIWLIGLLVCANLGLHLVGRCLDVADRFYKWRDNWRLRRSDARARKVPR